MDDPKQVVETRLTAYQQELVKRLKPLLDRLDPAEVTEDSGLRITSAEASSGWTNTSGSWDTTEGEGLALQASVKRRDWRVHAWDLYASPTECILGFAGGELLEWHGDPGGDATLVDEVMKFVEAYLAGLTVVEEYNKRARLIGIRYISHRDSKPLFSAREGSLGRLFRLRPKVERTRTFDVRFLK